MGLPSCLAALSLNSPSHPTSSLVPNKTPTRLRALTEAAKAKLRRARYDLAMFSRHTNRKVIDLSGDDDALDTIDIHPSRHATGPFAHRNAVQEEDHLADEGDLDDDAASSHPSVSNPFSGHRRRKSDYEKLFGVNSSSSPPIADQADYERALDDAAPKRHRSQRISLSGLHQADNSNAAKYFTTRNSADEQQPDLPSAITQAMSGEKAIGTAPVVEHEPCPYYHDEKYKLQMYRGSGYEHFPVVLGTVEGHKELCDLWDAQQAQRQRKLRPLSFKSQDSGLDATIAARVRRPIARQVSEMEQHCLAMALDVFPRISHDFVRKLYQGHCLSESSDAPDDPSFHPEQIPSQIIADIAEMDTYPLQKERKRKLPSPVADGSGVTILWKKDVPKTHHYCREAVALLAPEFAHIPTHYVQKVVLEKKSLFDAFNALQDSEKKYFSGTFKPYGRFKRPRKDLEKKYQRPEFEPQDKDLYASLVNELQAALQHQAREMEREKKQKVDDEEEAENIALHIAQGSMVECQCCFDEVPINRTVPCEGQQVHFFCNACVQRQAESQLAAMKYQMRCMDTSGCAADLSADGVARAVPIQVYDKLMLNQQHIEIAAAAIDGLEECPFCDFKAVCDQPLEVNSVFDCQSPSCAQSSCRKCKENSHLPKTCEEVKAEKGLSARHAIEEARSEAMMRTCPKCRVKIIKEYGCNKMVCTNCRTVLCYVCKQDISGKSDARGYDHFHRSGATCTLHDEPNANRHQQEADAAETAAIAKAKAEDADLDEATLRIEAHLHGEAARPTAPRGPHLELPGGQAIDNLAFMQARYFNQAPLPLVPRMPFPMVDEGDGQANRLLQHALQAQRLATMGPLVQARQMMEDRPPVLAPQPVGQLAYADHNLYPMHLHAHFQMEYQALQGLAGIQYRWDPAAQHNPVVPPNNAIDPAMWQLHEWRAPELDNPMQRAARHG